jgi:3',5'-cyclic-AMP phosphodiesterase
MRLAWLTDIHLNFVDAARVDEFLASVRDRADAVAVSGDIAEGHNLCLYGSDMAEAIQKPIYFVLGNHDFYRRSIPQVRTTVADLASESKYLNYLTAMNVVELTHDTAIIGHDGWADGRLGDYRRSNVILNDHLLISELARHLRFIGLVVADAHSLCHSWKELNME